MNDDCAIIFTWSSAENAALVLNDKIIITTRLGAVMANVCILLDMITDLWFDRVISCCLTEVGCCTVKRKFLHRRDFNRAGMISTVSAICESPQFKSPYPPAFSPLSARRS